MKIVLIINNTPTYLVTDIKRNKNGKLISGFVENGQWEIEIIGNNVIAKTFEGYIMSSTKVIGDIIEYDASSMKGSYNEIFFIISEILNKNKKEL
jgi:hypothetical protein